MSGQDFDWQAATPRERDAWISEHLFGWHWRWRFDPGGWINPKFANWCPPEKTDGEPVPAGKLAKAHGRKEKGSMPFYTTSVAADYEVLKRVRETWTQKRADAFAQHLYGIWDDRYATERLKSGVEGFYYTVGDYSHAAFLTLSAESQS